VTPARLSGVARRAFLGGGVGAVLAAALTDRTALAQPGSRTAGGRALVLTGGVNRGAYQAGVIAGLAEFAGLRDGDPLPYDILAGTSIGALNGYFVAAAQYSKLTAIWLEIPRRRVFRLKPQYGRVLVESSGVGTRLYQGLSLAYGMLHNVKGVMDAQIIRSMLHEYIDPAQPIHMPLFFAATNMTRRRSELFYRPGTTEIGRQRQARIDASLRDRPGRRRTRMADDSILHEALLSSVALPIAFDPILIPSADGSGELDEYIDGGMLNNAAIGLAQRTSAVAHVIDVDPPEHDEPAQKYANSLDIALGLFGMMQDTITKYATLYAYAESVLYADDPTAARSAGFADESLPLRIEFIAPLEELPGELGDFEDGDAIAEMLRIGREDARRGFAPFKASSLNL
jgi:predicted acylesterase/phospholipase RssA